MNSTNLLPCPFCGGNAVIVRETCQPTERISTRFDGDFTIARPRVNDGWLAECEKCGARGAHEYTTPIQSREEAITKWNRRTPAAVWCKDCEYYSEADEADDGAMCFNIDSDWCADYPSEYGSCEHGRRA